MDKLEKYRQIICQTLTPYVNITYLQIVPVPQPNYLIPE